MTGKRDRERVDINLIFNISGSFSYPAVFLSGTSEEVLLRLPQHLPPLQCR